MKKLTETTLTTEGQTSFDNLKPENKLSIWNGSNDYQKQILLNSGYNGEAEATKHTHLQQVGRGLRGEIGMIEPQCEIVKPVESFTTERVEYDVAKMSMPVEYAEKAGFVTGKWYVHNFKRAYDGMHSLSIMYICGFKGNYGFGYGFDFDGVFDSNNTLIQLSHDLYHEATEEFLIERFNQYADFTAGIIKELPRTFGKISGYKIGEWYSGVKGMNAFKVIGMNCITGGYEIMYFGKEAVQQYKDIPFRSDVVMLKDNDIRILLYRQAVKRGFRRKDLRFKDRHVYIDCHVVFNGNQWNTEVVTCREASVLTGVTVL